MALLVLNIICSKNKIDFKDIMNFNVKFKDIMNFNVKLKKNCKQDIILNFNVKLINNKRVRNNVIRVVLFDTEIILIE